MVFGAQVKDTGKGASREEAQQQAAKKVKSSFHLNGSYSSKTKTKAKAKTKTKTNTKRKTKSREEAQQQVAKKVHTKTCFISTDEGLRGKRLQKS